MVQKQRAADIKDMTRTRLEGRPWASETPPAPRLLGI